VSVPDFTTDSLIEVYWKDITELQKVQLKGIKSFEDEMAKIKSIGKVYAETDDLLVLLKEVDNLGIADLIIIPKSNIISICPRQGKWIIKPDVSEVNK